MILIVDDKRENIFSLQKTLELHGFEVDTADSGETALKKVLQTRYSLIILDVQMPGMDGFEVAEALAGSSRARDIPVIFLSAVNTEKRFITQGYKSGAIDYITKPVDPDILLLKVRTFYQLSMQRHELTQIQASLRKEIEIRKQAQSELDERIEELRSILQSLPQIAFTTERDGAVEYVNEQWYDYAHDMAGFPEMHPDDPPVQPDWQRALAAGAEFTRELRLRHQKRQEYRHFMLRIIPVRRSGEIVRWVGTFTDIHAQKLAHEELEQTVRERTRELLQKNAELEDRNHELQQFAWVASHDLREPLRKIQIYSALVKEKHCHHNPQAEQYLDRTIRASERMAQLINDLLDYSRLSVSILFEPTDLAAVIRDILADLELVIQEKNATVNVGPIPTIEAVPTQMRQVFQNLLSNSLKFSRPDIPPVITITAETIGEKEIYGAPRPAGPYCRIVVTDNGIGFDEKYLDRIFVLFQRLNSRDTYEGTGIGLSIAKKIVEKHNGLMTAQSRENEGASFIIVLPVKQAVAVGVE